MPKKPNFPTFKICSVCTWWLNPALRLLPLLPPPPPPFEAPGRSGAEEAPPPDDRLNELRGYLRGIVQFGLSFSQTRRLLLLLCSPTRSAAKAKAERAPFFLWAAVSAEERLSTMKTTPPMVVLVAFLHWGAHERALRGKFLFRAQLWPVLFYLFFPLLYLLFQQTTSFILLPSSMSAPRT